VLALAPDLHKRLQMGDGAGARCPLPDFSRSSRRCRIAKKDGTNSTARQVEAIMPLKTLTPSKMRALAPAPVAVTSGTTPRMKAKEIIRIGRNRALAASIAA
jgi:hypothetical protein